MRSKKVLRPRSTLCPFPAGGYGRIYLGLLATAPCRVLANIVRLVTFKLLHEPVR